MEEFMKMYNQFLKERFPNAKKQGLPFSIKEILFYEFMVWLEDKPNEKKS